MSLAMQSPRADDLIDLIHQQTIPLVLQKIDEITDLNELRVKKKGKEAIHLAAMFGMDDVFLKLVERGVSPFTRDDQGYSPYYYARTQYIKLKQGGHHAQILEWYKKTMTLDFLADEALSTKHRMDGALLDNGFQPYIINRIVTDDDLSKPEALKQFFELLLQKGTLPDFTANNQKPDPKTFTLVTPAFLSDVAAGTLEQFAPTETMAMLCKLYPKLEWTQKMTCVYLVKELIRNDSDREWVEKNEFKDRLKDFITLVEFDCKSVPALATMRTKLENYHAAHASRPHTSSARALAWDLTRAFGVAVRDITPDSFRAEHLKPKTQSAPVKNLIALTDQLTRRVALDILHSQNPIAMVEFYIDAIRHCLKDKDSKKSQKKTVLNLAAAFAIYNGIINPGIARLKLTEQIDDHEKEHLARFDVLFSATDNCKAMRTAMAAQPECIPIFNLFLMDKSKNADNDVDAQILYSGKISTAFSRHRKFLMSLDYLDSMKRRTDLPARLGEIAAIQYDVEDELNRLSYQIEPHRVIVLNPELTLDNLKTALEECLAKKAPLVVEEKGERFDGVKAKGRVVQFLHHVFGHAITFKGDSLAGPVEPSDPKELSMREIIGLCTKVMRGFDFSGKNARPAMDDKAIAQRKIGIKEKRMSRTTDDIESLAKQLDGLSLDAPSIAQKLERAKDDLDGLRAVVSSPDMASVSKTFHKKLVFKGPQPPQDQMDIVPAEATAEVAKTPRDPTITLARRERFAANRQKNKVVRDPAKQPRGEPQPSSSEPREKKARSKWE